MTMAMQGAIQANRAAAVKPASAPAKQAVNTMLNSILDSEGYRKRFDELLGRRAPQFVSALITLVNGDKKLQEAFYNAPVTVIQAALRAATYDLPIDPNLGYAYIVPFNNSYQDDAGNWHKRMEAAFIMGYKGMNQLALRTGAYKTINVIDVREGELKSYNRLTEEIVIDFIEDEDERNQKEIIGWCGYFKLINGTEKTIYMSRKQIEAHERKNRKGQNMGKGWREDFNAMAEKTVYRRLIGKFGLMSIDYQRANAATLAAADAIATGHFDDEDNLQAPGSGSIVVESTADIVDTDTGEVSDTMEDAK